MGLRSTIFKIMKGRKNKRERGKKQNKTKKAFTGGRGEIMSVINSFYSDLMSFY